MRIVFVFIKPWEGTFGFQFSSSILEGNFAYSPYSAWAKHAYHLANALRLLPVGDVVERVRAYYCIEGRIGVRYFEERIL